ncbi:farnesyl-diphosphate farnesyltransferase [Dimargaris cristalligena]|uniref:Squalene synthase n=1 Tax=Dimargaris cristalligena TaxID=215637 RepID=A0A4P9ZW37_9FUNG|nr:farnesyl-diphosphate farnesyltransferase [Dimargaris cristalligena]|eukprot:RKP37508.1 farnesyl-diphosphate farnesyltransferase [Dimargaris cristalligena]
MIKFVASNPPSGDDIAGTDDPNLRRCYEFLDMTSRSFTMVIKQLAPSLRDVVCLYYLALRGLDTLEDDMTIPLDYKVTLLRSFHSFLTQPGWCFTESGEDEKDAPLLVEYAVVIDQFMKLDPKYQDIIVDSAKRMGNGMADFCIKRVTTKADYELYCHYVAGLVGEGLSALFAASGLEDSELAEQKRLSNSLGLFLQKTNIVRDYLEDLHDTRQFWPKEIWGLYAKDLKDFVEPGQEKQALACLNHMCMDALSHVPDVFEYLSMLRDPSVFRFVAIPQLMAIATITRVFNNYDVFRKVVKIRKGEAVKMIMECTNINAVRGIFIKYLYEFHHKNSSTDPNYIKINEVVGRSLAMIQPHYQPPPGPGLGSVAAVATVAAVGVTLYYNWSAPALMLF